MQNSEMSFDLGFNFICACEEVGIIHALRDYSWSHPEFERNFKRMACEAAAELYGHDCESIYWDEEAEREDMQQQALSLF